MFVFVAICMTCQQLIKCSNIIKRMDLVAEHTVDLRIPYIGEIVYECFSEMNFKLEKCFFFTIHSIC